MGLPWCLRNMFIHRQFLRPSVYLYKSLLFQHYGIFRTNGLHGLLYRTGHLPDDGNRLFKSEGQELGLVVIKKYAGRLLECGLLDHYAYAMLYLDADDNCLPSSGDILLTPDYPNLVHEQASRLDAIFPEDIPFPEYPSEP